MPFSNAEIKHTIFSMVHNKSPGSYGFLAEFFQRFWSIMGIEVSKVIREIQSSEQLLKSWNATFLDLILKVVDTKDFKQFYPISLCNVVYKIITKTLAKIIKMILPHLISP